MPSKDSKEMPRKDSKEMPSKDSKEMPSTDSKDPLIIGTESFVVAVDKVVRGGMECGLGCKSALLQP
jgi:hypothetical protein